MVKYKFNDRILSARGSYRFKIKRLYNSADRYSPKKSYTFDRITLPGNFLQVNISFTIREMIVVQHLCQDANDHVELGFLIR